LKVELADALIAAGAVANGAGLWTRNRKHYPMKEVVFLEQMSDHYRDGMRLEYDQAYPRSHGRLPLLIWPGRRNRSNMRSVATHYPMS
jgi:hypothetical protein